MWMRYTLTTGKKIASQLSEVGVSEIETYINQGQFASGSMGPKVIAAARFIRNGGREAIIANLNMLEQALDGKSGTRILPD